MKEREIKAVCVYSASSTKIKPLYNKVAQELGHLMAKQQLTLINGGGNLGLMRTVIDAVMEKGGKTVGVIPTFMVEQNWHHPAMSELVTVENMHLRKEKMAALSDGVIALPGGCGTLEELLEIITWKQLGLYLHPIVILNIDHYFDPLLEMLAKATEEHFMRAEHTAIWRVAETPKAAIELLYTTAEWDVNLRKFAAI
ncbi:MAG: TIGR00730 family Rossman fold protein [Bacteroidaceae bacterium]